MYQKSLACGWQIIILFSTPCHLSLSGIWITDAFNYRMSLNYVELFMGNLQYIRSELCANQKDENNTPQHMPRRNEMESILQIENHWQASTSHVCLNGLTNVWIEYKIFVDNGRQISGLSCTWAACLAKNLKDTAQHRLLDTRLSICSPSRVFGCLSFNDWRVRGVSINRQVKCRKIEKNQLKNARQSVVRKSGLGRQVKGW